jgi:hypothetical protein
MFFMGPERAERYLKRYLNLPEFHRVSERAGGESCGIATGCLESSGPVWASLAASEEYQRLSTETPTPMLKGRL